MDIARLIAAAIFVFLLFGIPALLYALWNAATRVRPPPCSEPPDRPSRSQDSIPHQTVQYSEPRPGIFVQIWHSFYCRRHGLPRELVEKEAYVPADAGQAVGCACVLASATIGAMICFIGYLASSDSVSRIGLVFFFPLALAGFALMAKVSFFSGLEQERDERKTQKRNLARLIAENSQRLQGMEDMASHMALYRRYWRLAARTALSMLRVSVSSREISETQEDVQFLEKHLTPDLPLYSNLRKQKRLLRHLERKMKREQGRRRAKLAEQREGRRPDSVSAGMVREDPPSVTSESPEPQEEIREELPSVTSECPEPQEEIRDNVRASPAPVSDTADDSPPGMWRCPVCDHVTWDTWSYCAYCKTPRGGR